MRTLVKNEEEHTADDQLADAAVVQWELVDIDGQHLRGGQIAVQPTISLYDRTADWTGRTEVSDPARFYFALEPAARRMRFRAVEGSALLSCYTRPPDVTKVTHVPEDYSAYERGQSGKRTWFITRPLQHHQYAANGRSLSLIVQTRPPQINDELLAGRYQWQDYHPQGAWSARQLLVPRHTSLPFRLVAASTTYGELDANCDYMLTLAGRPDRTHLTPRIIFANSSPPQSLRFYVDGKLHDSHVLHAARGEIDLLPVVQSQSPHPRRIRIETDAPVRLFLNHVYPQNLPVFQKRLANRLRDSKLCFPYDKRTSQSELLLMRYFRSGENASCLKVRIHGKLPRATGPTRDWTLTERVFDLRPTASRPAIVLHNSTETVDEGQLIFLPLGDDLPAGEYAIEVESLDGDDGYLMLYQLTSGMPEHPPTFTERHHELGEVKPPQAPYRTISRLLSEASVSGTYGQPADAELWAAEQLFREILDGQLPLAHLQRSADQLDFHLLEISTESSPIWVLREDPESKRGRGFYAFRRGDPLPIVLQAPHCFYEGETRDITRQLFARSQALAAAWNTLHRTTFDVAHERRSYLNALTAAFLHAPAGACGPITRIFAAKERDR